MQWNLVMLILGKWSHRVPGTVREHNLEEHFFFPSVIFVILLGLPLCCHCPICVVVCLSQISGYKSKMHSLLHFSSLWKRTERERIFHTSKAACIFLSMSNKCVKSKEILLFMKRFGFMSRVLLMNNQLVYVFKCRIAWPKAIKQEQIKPSEKMNIHYAL